MQRADRMRAAVQLAAAVLTVASVASVARAERTAAGSAGRPARRRRPRTGDAAAHHDDDRVGGRRRDSGQVHAGGGSERGVAGAEVVAGAAGHAKLRAADARSGAGAQQGLEDGHHALADLEHPGHVDRTAGRRARRASCPTAAARSACGRTRTWDPARRPDRTTTTRSSSTRSTRSSRCRRARRRKRPTRAPRSSTRWTATCSARPCSSRAFTADPTRRRNPPRAIPVDRARFPVCGAASAGSTRPGEIGVQRLALSCR